MRQVLKFACITLTLSLLFAVTISSSALAADGRLFMVDGNTSHIVELDPDNGAVLNSFSTPYPSSEGPDGLAYCNGRMFFTADHEGPDHLVELIYEVNPDNGDVINSFPAPGDAIDALGLSCNRLFALDYEEADTIYVLNPDTGETIAVLDHEPPLVGGATFAGTRNSLFISGPADDSSTIYELNPETAAVINSFEVDIDTWGLGFSSSRNTLFIGEGGPLTIYEVDPDNGDVINSFSVGDAMVTALAADECVCSTVGGDVYPVNKYNILVPWLALGVVLIIGSAILLRRRV
ncbi:hypothetical protein ACFLX1_02380 [Chloroflexota bacterium]